METLKEYAQERHVGDDGLKILKHVTNNQFASIFKRRRIGATSAFNSFVTYETWRNKHILYIHPNFTCSSGVESVLRWTYFPVFSNLWVSNIAMCPSIMRGIRFDYIIFDEVSISDVKQQLPYAFGALKGNTGSIVVNSSERDVMYDVDFLSFALLKV